jgi:diguanylate cyclase (GGDEF)-like protein
MMSKANNTAELTNNAYPAPDSLVMPAGDLFHGFLTFVGQLFRAETVTLLIGSKSVSESSVLLLHEGLLAPVPELQTKRDALNFVAEFKSADVNHQEIAKLPPVHLYKSVAKNGCLVRIALTKFQSMLWAEQRVTLREERRKSEPATVDRFDVDVWIGLRYDDSEFSSALEQLQNTLSVSAGPSSGWLEHPLVSSLSLGGYMSWQYHQIANLLRDPASKLPGRAEFQAHLKLAFYEASVQKQSLALIMVNPDEFGFINQRFDHEKGDEVLANIAEKLNAGSRRSDALFRYGGAVFAAVLPCIDKQVADKIASKISRTLTGVYLDGEVRLAFSIGIAVYTPNDTANLDSDENALLRRADHALNLAKRAGGGRAVMWEPGGADTTIAHLDRLSGIFTADTEKDYRNMLLLWDTIAVVSSSAEKETIANEFVKKVVSTLKPNWVALFEHNDNSEPQLLASSCVDKDKQTCRATNAKLILSDKQKQLLSRTRQSRRIERLRFKEGLQSKQVSHSFLVYTVPLIAREQYLGCLYVDGPEENFSLDSSDQVFLNALAGQIALALDRADLAQRWKKEKERDSQQLREEVRELREVLHSAKLVYRSEQLQLVLDTIRAVAPTDVTILITGESGTGKEMLANSVHEQSGRQSKPLVIVDCSTIAHNLMEAELFGHTKGAYTGADISREGRIIQAEGGTLFLDEVGEIPLNIQVKLLRFVQEKEITPVGGKHSRYVDVRIVAATNRDLSVEVAQGRFREDLYYRLNVVMITAPPLRDRRGDILPLARHFVEKFSLQYNKGVRRLTAEAESALLAHHWPGNVRELQNSILRTVVLSTTEKIDRSELQLKSEDGKQHVIQQYLDAKKGATVPVLNPALNPALNPVLKSQPRAEPVVEESAAEHGVRGKIQGDQILSPGLEPEPEQKQEHDPWQALRRGIENQVDTAIRENNGAPVPLGRWLTEDLVREADKVTGGVARRAALLLGLAETTFRRQLEKTKQAELSGLRVRTPAWSLLQAVLPRLVVSLSETEGKSIITDTRNMMLESVKSRVANNIRLGAALMGVTVPTYQRWTNLS